MEIVRRERKAVDLTKLAVTLVQESVTSTEQITQKRTASIQLLTSIATIVESIDHLSQRPYNLFNRLKNVYRDEPSKQSLVDFAIFLSHRSITDGVQD